MKKAIVFLVLAGALAGGVYYWQGREARAKNGAPQVPTAEVERGEIRLTVTSTGRVVANLDVEIKCKASGEVVEVPFDVSDPVGKDKLVVKIDPTEEQRHTKQAAVALAASQAKLAQADLGLLIAERDLVTARKQAQVTLKAAQARASDARARAARKKKLLDKKLVSEDEHATAETAAILADAEFATAQLKLEQLDSQELALEDKRQEVKLVQAQVDSDEIAQTLAQQRLQDTTVIAPISGVVTTRSVQKGQIISSGISNVGGGTTVLTLSDLSRIFVLASVDESDIGKVLVGLPVDVTADAYPGKQFTGKVERIAPKGVNTSNVVTFEVKIEVIGKGKALLKPEMTANVEILVAQKDDALIVPAEAVSRKGRQQIAVVANDDGTTEERPVKTGISDGARLEIIEGLKEHETVLVREAEAESKWRRSGRPMMFGARGGKR